MKLIENLFQKYLGKKVKLEKSVLNWKNKDFAIEEVINDTYRKKPFGNLFFDEAEMNLFKSNLREVLYETKPRDRTFGIKGEMGYNKFMDSSVIHDSLIYRDGLILGYEKGRASEQERFEKELERVKSPELVEVEERNYLLERKKFVKDLILHGILSVSWLGYIGYCIVNVLKN